MLPQVRRTVGERRLLARGDHVVVACSFGPDSVAMTHALARLAGELGVTLVVASVDHGLRVPAADEVRAAGRLADALALPFRALEVRVQGSGSVHRRAREARYAALLALARTEGARRIAVGHTMDDQAETVLSRMLRGAGLEGLSGIAPARADGIVRPLIDVRRAEVERYVTEHALAHVRDPSNDDPRFERARLRRAVLPVLVAEDPQIVPHLARLADDARAAAHLVRRRAERLLVGHGFPARDPPVDALLRAPEAVRRSALRRWVQERTRENPRRAHITSLERLLEEGGEVLLGGSWGALVREGELRAEHNPRRRTRSTRKHD